MDYGKLLTDAGRVTWRHKWLWLLGLFAGGGGVQFTTSGPQSLTQYQFTGNEAQRFVEDHLAAIVVFTLLGFLLLLVLVVVSIVATGGLIAGADSAYRGEARPTRDAWRRGLGAFWRIVGLGLVVGVAVVLVVVLLVALIVVPLVVTSAGNDGGPPAAVIVFAVVTGLLLLLVLVLAFVVLGIVMNWALRALVLEGRGIFGSLSDGWRLFRDHLGPSLLIWALSLGLGIALGALAAAVLVAIGLPVLAIGGAAWQNGSPFLWALVPVAVLIALVVLGLLKAVTETYFSAYWTIAYRNLTALAETGGLEGAAGLNPPSTGPGAGTSLPPAGMAPPPSLPMSPSPPAERPPGGGTAV